MPSLDLTMVVCLREMEGSYLALLKRLGAGAAVSALCQGTAGQNILNLFGLEKTEKSLIAAVTRADLTSKIMREMVSALGLDMPGCGIALSVPLGSVGGETALEYLLDAQTKSDGEVTDMPEKSEQTSYPFDLLIAVCERGSAEQVMSSARTAGAGGGTIVHARGTATEFTARFFGVSIAAERDLLLIVLKHENKDAVMRAIMDQTGLRSDAHTAVFSLPVSSVAGLRSLTEQKE